MKKWFLLFSTIVAILFTGGVSAQTSSDIMCTMEYAPVCGSVQVQCITAPCNPVRQTFGNACMARAAQATDVVAGECESTPTPPIVGGDRDRHGCIGSAGYSWNSHLKSCVRPWETKTMVLNISGNRVSCMGVSPMMCLQRIEGSKRSFFYDTIAGFDPLPGMSYRILVRRDRLENPPADASMYTYSLLRVLSKRPDLSSTSWKLSQYNGTGVTETATLSFARNRLNAKFCNTMSANYHLMSGSIVAPVMMRTEMYCMSPLMQMEDHFDLSHAKYTLSGTTLSIETDTGNRYNFLKQ